MKPLRKATQPGQAESTLVYSLYRKSPLHERGQPLYRGQND